MSTATGTAKRCVNCNKDVTSDKRMKDSSGKYWCVKCGEADQLKKGQTGTSCGNCGDRYPAGKLTKFGASKLCPTCYKARTKGPGLRESLAAGGGEGTDKKRLYMGLGVMAVLAVGVVYRFMHM